MMLKKLSIKGKITLWYAFLLIIICVVSLGLLWYAAQQAVLRYCEDTLISASIVLQDELEVEHGYLEIDDDIDDVPNVYAGLFYPDGSLIYGRAWVDVPFESGIVRSVSTSDHSWYVYDVPIDVAGWENTWLRLCMSSDELSGMQQAMRSVGLWLLPLLALLALLGGYCITAHAFKPVQRMNDVTASIVSADDLSARITVNADQDGDELHRLGATINNMLQRLELAFQREQQFTSDAAHELRTPLNAMITQGEYALSRTDAAEKDEAILQMLDRAGEMNDLVRQLLMLARLESGQLHRDELCQLDALLSDIAADMEPVAQERDMTLDVRLSPCQLLCSRAMITRAVINLLDNAVRYGREKGHISLSLSSTEQEITISVADDGGSLEADDVDNVFTRFWRADSSRASQGNGIGLALVHSIVKAHGGSASASVVPQKQTTFTLHFPTNISENE